MKGILYLLYIKYSYHLEKNTNSVHVSDNQYTNQRNPTNLELKELPQMYVLF